TQGIHNVANRLSPFDWSAGLAERAAEHDRLLERLIMNVQRQAAPLAFQHAHQSTTRHVRACLCRVCFRRAWNFARQPIRPPTQTTVSMDYTSTFLPVQQVDSIPFIPRITDFAGQGSAKLPMRRRRSGGGEPPRPPDSCARARSLSQIRCAGARARYVD